MYFILKKLIKNYGPNICGPDGCGLNIVGPYNCGQNIYGPKDICGPDIKIFCYIGMCLSAVRYSLCQPNSGSSEHLMKLYPSPSRIQVST